MSHHLHADFDEAGRMVVHCVKCRVSLLNQIPAEPCDRDEVAVLCQTHGTEPVVIQMGEEDD